MKRILSASVVVLLLTGSVSSFAAPTTYTDLNSGFKLKAHPSWMEIGGKNFFGLSDKPEKKEAALNLVCAFTAKEIKNATGKKFTTEEFISKYKDLQVLERNGLSPDKANYLFFMPDPYEIKENNKLSLFSKNGIKNPKLNNLHEINKVTIINPKAYKCECGKIFSTEENQRLHYINIHLHEKPYNCSFCGEGFSHRNGKIYHERVYHTFIFPYPCKECTSAFASKSALIYHIRSKHKPNNVFINKNV